MEGELELDQIEAAEFDEAFEIVDKQEEELKDSEGNTIRRKRVYWKDIIEMEEKKAKEKAGADSDMQLAEVPMTEEEAARVKGYGKDGQPLDPKDNSTKHIGTVDPIADFKTMVNDRKTDRVNSAMTQMRDVIERYIRGSLNGDIYDKALDCLLELRKACVNEDEAPFFNKFMATLKEKYSQSKTHYGFWHLLSKQRVSLITCLESELSSVISPKEAEDFFKMTA